MAGSHPTDANRVFLLAGSPVVYTATGGTTWNASQFPVTIGGHAPGLTAIFGTPDYCAERIVEIAKLDVRNLYVMPFQTFVPPEQEVRTFRDHIFPHLRAAGLRLPTTRTR